MQITLQVLILGTGNYTFFNYLTIVLSLSCFDDGCLGFSATNTVAIESGSRESDSKSTPPATTETKKKSKSELQPCAYNPPFRLISPLRIIGPGNRT